MMRSLCFVLPIMKSAICVASSCHLTGLRYRTYAGEIAIITTASPPLTEMTQNHPMPNKFQLGQSFVCLLIHMTVVYYL